MMTTTTMLITPAIARAFLANNHHNRPIKRHRVRQYAADIKAGRWEENGETIKIAKDGSVLDGQHRLLAIVQSDTPARMLVVQGLPRSVFATIDQGVLRNTGDLMAVSGHANGSTLGAVDDADVPIREWAHRTWTPR